jgi:ribosomal protein S25
MTKKQKNKKTKKQTKKNFTNIILDRGLISKINKELKNVLTIKPSKNIFKMVYKAKQRNY